MTTTLQLISGNDLNALADTLGQDFFSASSTAFERRLVIAPHPSIKEFLFKRFAATPHLKIAAGIQVLPLHQSVMEILGSEALLPNKKRLPSFLELALSIEEKLHALARSLGASLETYLHADTQEKRQRRIAALSDELALLFVRYGLFGKQFLPQWLKGEGWQQMLWRALFSEDSPWTYPLQVLQSAQAGSFQGKIAVFGFSYLSAAHLSFFATFSASLYQLSACSLFWEDFVSDKERLLTRRFLKKQGAQENVREEIDGYMQQSHPLLGNFGKLGREMLKALDCLALNGAEIYKELDRQSLLCQLKNSMLYLDEDAVLQSDDSLQLHSATSRMREVEICRDTLQRIVHQRAQDPSPILPRDIVVCSPDIASYAPYIHMLFSDSGFAYSVDAAQLRDSSDAVRGFLQMLALPLERYSLESIVKVLHCPMLLEKWVFSPEEMQRLERGFKDAKVVQDLSGHPNSWEEGLDRLLLGLAMIPDETTSFSTWPVSGIAHSEIDLFNRFLLWFSTLKNDLALLVGEKSAPEWLEVFLRVAAKYFVIEWEKELFFQEIKSLALSCCNLKEKVWNFSSIARVLHHLAGQTTGAGHSSQMNRIIFTSLTAGSVQSARILWCLGIDEAAYPRADNKSSLCEMSRLQSVDYFPSKSDEDRSCFLEMLIKAEDYLLFSYQRIHREDAKHQGPSALIEELDQYLQKRGISGGIKKIDHPSLPFDQSYFCRGSTRSQEDYLAAQAHYSSRSDRKPFFPSPLRGAQSPCASAPAEESRIDIRQLKKLARNPLQFYFNETLKIYLKEEKDEEEEQFWISPLRRALFRKQVLRHSASQVVRHLEGRGAMPRGLFSKVAEADIQEEGEALLSLLNTFSVRPEEIGSVRLFPACREEEGKQLCLSLSDARDVHLTGELENITPKGLLVYENGDLKSLVKVWPLYLIYCCLYPENQVLLLTKKGIKLPLALEDPQAVLASYLDYYFLAKCSPSPLMPEWIKAVFLGKEHALRALLSKPPLYEDPYLNYINRRAEGFDAKELLLQWSDVVKKTFGPLLHAL